MNFTNADKVKEKTKKYTHKTRKIRVHDIRNGNTIFVRQRKKNKYSTPFEPIQYIVERVKGTMITASTATDERRSAKEHQNIHHLTIKYLC